MGQHAISLVARVAGTEVLGEVQVVRADALEPGPLVQPSGGDEVVGHVQDRAKAALVCGAHRPGEQRGARTGQVGVLVDDEAPHHPELVDRSPRRGEPLQGGRIAWLGVGEGDVTQHSITAGLGGDPRLDHPGTGRPRLHVGEQDHRIGIAVVGGDQECRDTGEVIGGAGTDGKRHRPRMADEPARRQARGRIVRQDGCMKDVVAALQAQQDELALLVTDASDADLGRASRCGGWSVGDVLLHLAQTNEMAVASVEGRLESFIVDVASNIPPVGGIDQWAGALVDLQRTDDRASRDRWVRSAADQQAAFTRCDPDARVRWVAGELAARTLATTRLTETWIHTVDVAVAFGPPPPPTRRLWHTARLTWRTVPYALAQADVAPSGPVAFVLEAPDESTWVFGDVDDATTTITGTALDLCTVAGQRGSANGTSLRGTGPDAGDVLAFMRTFA